MAADSDKPMTLGKLAKKVKRHYTTIKRWVLEGCRNQHTEEVIYLQAEQDGAYLETTMTAYLEFKRQLNVRSK